MHIITIEDVEDVHGLLTLDYAAGHTQYGLGPFTAAARAGWEAIIGSLYPIFGQDPYPTVMMKAARVLYGGATTQYLLDGNKRLAIAAMQRQLGLRWTQETLHGSPGSLMFRPGSLTTWFATCKSSEFLCEGEVAVNVMASTRWARWARPTRSRLAPQ